MLMRHGEADEARLSETELNHSTSRPEQARHVERSMDRDTRHRKRCSAHGTANDNGRPRISKEPRTSRSSSTLLRFSLTTASSCARHRIESQTTQTVSATSTGPFKRGNRQKATGRTAHDRPGSNKPCQATRHDHRGRRRTSGNTELPRSGSNPNGSRAKSGLRNRIAPAPTAPGTCRA
jgi:hypothetical protein